MTRSLLLGDVKAVPLIEILSQRFIHRVLVYHFALPYHQYFLVRTPPGERIIDVGSLVCFLLGKVSCGYFDQ